MAIDDLLDEHEQGERVRGWIRRNGAGVVGGIVLGLALIGGWQWWQARQAQARAQAGARYDSALKALEAQGVEKSASLFAALDGTPYEALGALALAKAQVGADRREDAIKTLRGAARGDSGMDAVVDKRLARLLIDAGKSEQAITLLAGSDDVGAFEILGDAQFAAGKIDAARASYVKALKTAEEGSPQRRLLELKLSDIGMPAANAVDSNKPQEAKS